SAGAAHGGAPHDVLAPRAAEEVSAEVRLEVSGRYGVDPHPGLGPFDGEYTSESIDSALARGVGSDPLIPYGAVHGGDIDDRSAARLREASSCRSGTCEG